MAKVFSKQFYDSALWRRTRKQVLRQSGYTCHDCGGRATEVHHIIELTPSNIDDWDISINPNNLQPLCWDCHNKTTRGSADLVDGYVFNEQGQVEPIT